MCMTVFVYTNIYSHVHAWCPEKSEVGIEFPGNGGLDDWEQNPGLLQEQQVLLTSKQTFHPQIIF